MASCSRRTVLSTLAERGPLAVTALAAALEVHPLTVKQQCENLHAAGYARQVSGDVYDITAVGEAYLARRVDSTRRD